MDADFTGRVGWWLRNSKRYPMPLRFERGMLRGQIKGKQVEIVYRHRSKSYDVIVDGQVVDNAPVPTGVADALTLTQEVSDALGEKIHRAIS